MVHFTFVLSAAALYSAVALAMPMDTGMTTTSTAMMGDKTPMMDMSGSSSMMMDSSSTAMMDSKPTTMMEYTTSSMMAETTSTPMMAATTSTSMSMAMPTYGSGSSNWGNAYDSCVQQCVAQYGSPAATYTPTATATEGSKGTGATHTVIVAPSQGVLRYMPFAVNASVGDTVKFMWGANMHTVTKGSQLQLCNKTSDVPFASGLQNKSFVFEQVVNDTKPMYFFCAAPSHCQKGMFGIINPPTSPGAAASMMGQMAQNSSNMAAMDSYAKMMTKSSELAGNWGANINARDMPEWAKPEVAANIYFTRMFLAANKELMKDDGRVDLGAGNGAPMAIPPDITQALNAAGSGGAAAAISAAPSSATSSATAAKNVASASGSAAPSGAPTNGAASVVASSAITGVVAAVAMFFAL